MKTFKEFVKTFKSDNLISETLIFFLSSGVFLSLICMIYGYCELHGIHNSISKEILMWIVELVFIGMWFIFVFFNYDEEDLIRKYDEYIKREELKENEKETREYYKNKYKELMEE